MEKLIIDENFEGLTKDDNGKYEYDGNIDFDGNIEFVIDVKLKGYINAGCGINAVGEINAGCGINAVEGIMAGDGINAGGEINAGEGIELYKTKTKKLKIIYGEKYNVYIMDDHIKIGCKLFSKEEWENFTDKEIKKMDNGALDFWNENKCWILAF